MKKAREPICLDEIELTKSVVKLTGDRALAHQNTVYAKILEKKHQRRDISMNNILICLIVASVLLVHLNAIAAQPTNRDFPNETEVKGNCDSDGAHCKNIAVAFRLDPHIPGAGPQFASSECVERGMLPTEIERVWTRAGGEYGTRIWMVMCEAPKD